MKMTVMMWGSNVSILKRAAERNQVTLSLFSQSQFKKNPESIDQFINSVCSSDVSLLSSVPDELWDRIEHEITNRKISVPIITLRHNPEQWKHATVEPEVITTCLAYTINNGDENFDNMLRYIRKIVLGEDLQVTPPVEIPWEGIYHPDTAEVFTSVDEYLNWYEKRNPTPAPYVGILFSRIYWAAANTAIEDLLIKSLEHEGLKVIPVFSMDYGGRRNTSKNTLEVLEEFLVHDGKPRVDAIIKLTSSLLRNTIDPNENEE